MARSISGFLGTFDSIATLLENYSPQDYVGCSANIGLEVPYRKVWCDGVEWNGFDTTDINVALSMVAQSIMSFPGVVGDGVNDDTAGIQAAADSRKVIFFPTGTFRITSEIVFKVGTRFYGSGNWSGISSIDKTTGTTRILYDGPVAVNSCIFRLASHAVGTEPPSAAASQMQNIALCNITLDGNDKAEFGLYMVRAWSNNPLDYITVTGTTKHAFYAATCFNGSPTNWMAFKNKGCGITLGRDLFGWSAGVSAVDQSTCTSFFGYYSGHNASTVIQNQFDETTNQEAEYGIGVYGGRALIMLNAQSNECSGVGILVKSALKPVRFIGGYSEGNGQSSGSTKEWAIFFIGVTGAVSQHVIFDGMHLGLTPAIRLTGTEPSRKEAGVQFINMPLLNEIDADWGNYRLVDSDRNVTFSGMSPSWFRERHNSALNLTPIGICHFDVTGAAIVPLSQEGIISNITYDSTGIYTITMSENFTSARWVAQVTGTDNRTLGISNRTVNSFKIYSRLNDGSMALTDSSGIMVVVWGYYV
jgi:hypothetical protein